MLSRWGLTLAAIAVAGCAGDDDPTAHWIPPTGPPVHVSGRAFVFGPNRDGLSLEGATVAMTEAPEYATTVAADGSFALDVPGGGPATFTLAQPGFHPNQSATLDLGDADVADLGFQAPTESTFQLLASLADVAPDPTRCQISTTVSRAGTEPYGGDGLGEPDTVVAISPSLPADAGPIYFAYASNIIYPDRALTATSIDGGVIFGNAPVGDYTLTATKAGVAFTTVGIRCRAGVLVNAAPPHGLQER